MEGIKKRIIESSRGKARIKQSRKTKPVDLPEDPGSESYQEESTYDEFTENSWGETCKEKRD